MKKVVIIIIVIVVLVGGYYALRGSSVTPNESGAAGVIDR